MSKKRNIVTPYQRLLQTFREYVNAVEYPHRKSMWTYPMAKLEGGWDLSELRQRVAAAEQLGYETMLEATDDGLRVMYRKKRPEAPWEVR